MSVNWLRQQRGANRSSPWSTWEFHVRRWCKSWCWSARGSGRGGTLKATHRCGFWPSMSTTLLSLCCCDRSAAPFAPCCCPSSFHFHRKVRLPAVTATRSPVEWKA
eukprot:349164-Prymnesium_polylepis.1